MNTSGAVSLQYLAELVYELLDAHGDTVTLAGELVDDPAWAAHVNYLQGLQRVSREALARLEGTERMNPLEGPTASGAVPKLVPTAGYGSTSVGVRDPFREPQRQRMPLTMPWKVMSNLHSSSSTAACATLCEIATPALLNTIPKGAGAHSATWPCGRRRLP